MEFLWRSQGVDSDDASAARNFRDRYRPDRARGDQQRVTVHADRALEVLKKRQR